MELRFITIHSIILHTIRRLNDSETSFIKKTITFIIFNIVHNNGTEKVV